MVCLEQFFSYCSGILRIDKVFSSFKNIGWFVALSEDIRYERNDRVLAARPMQRSACRGWRKITKPRDFVHCFALLLQSPLSSYSLDAPTVGDTFPSLSLSVSLCIHHIPRRPWRRAIFYAKTSVCTGGCLATRNKKSTTFHNNTSTTNIYSKKRISDNTFKLRVL